MGRTENKEEIMNKRILPCWYGIYECRKIKHQERGAKMCQRKRPDWPEYFLKIAEAVSERATCIRRIYGAVIVKDNIMVSTGYCGAPHGIPNCIDIMVCKRKELNILSGERYELCVSVHAEANAIIQASREALIGATIYIAGFDCETGEKANAHPCLMCRRMIKNARIKEAIFWQDGKIKKISAEKL